MTSPYQSRRPAWPALAWSFAALFAGAGPVLALWLMVAAPTSPPPAPLAAPLLAVGLMGTGMIAAAASARLWTGIALALLVGAAQLALARLVGLPPIAHPLAAVLALAVAGFSFAARGALFARSAGDKGWLIALFVVAGEAAILATAAARPEALPAWLLVLLPAQWASMAIAAGLTGSGPALAAASLIAPLLALAGTAAATLLVARLWPRRWPYLVMFTTWLGLSALVWFAADFPVQHAEGLWRASRDAPAPAPAGGPGAP